MNKTPEQILNEFLNSKEGVYGTVHEYLYEEFEGDVDLVILWFLYVIKFTLEINQDAG